MRTWRPRNRPKIRFFETTGNEVAESTDNVVAESTDNVVAESTVSEAVVTPQS